MTNLPFPSNENQPVAEFRSGNAEECPWQAVRTKEHTPIMFRLRFHDGRTLSFAYSDLRETRMLHDGHLVLCLYGMEKYHVIVEGRRLSELASLIEMARIKSLEEDGPRSFERDESKPAIDRITVETLTGPSN